MAETPVKELTKRFHHNKILEACKALFFEKGYESVTSDEIAAFAGYSKRTVYVYFKSKEDILQQLKEESLRRYEQELAAAPLAYLEDFFQFTRSFARENPADHYFLKRIVFSKANEQDYFTFMERFKPLFCLLNEQYHCNLVSPDIPLLLWNSLLYAIDNDIPVSRLNQLFLHGIAD